jgi:hypothetical protein
VFSMNGIKTLIGFVSMRVFVLLFLNMNFACLKKFYSVIYAYYHLHSSSFA